MSTPETPRGDRDDAPRCARVPARLLAWAREAGFDAAGVARLEPMEHGAAFAGWLERGDQAAMEYLERRVEVRREPERVLPGARSALCVALQYHPLDGEGEMDGDLWPRVARYARGRDYHNLMGKRLKKLARRVREAFPGTDTRVYVDTGPVLERELAARAGLGAVGKNTNLLSRGLGSWFLLGELFTTLDLAPAAEPLADLCGRCTLCLEACPTGALPEPYRLDANRCISYWTIEHRGAMPAAVRRQVGDWVFGCDVCQEVCPWNLRYAGRADRGGVRPADHPDLRLPPQRRELDLAALLALGREDYEERFRGSAMKRARLEGLKRNAAVAMGNRGDRRYVAALGRALADGGRPGGARARGVGAGGDRGAGGEGGVGGGAGTGAGRGGAARDRGGARGVTGVEDVTAVAWRRWRDGGGGTVVEWTVRGWGLPAWGAASYSVHFGRGLASTSAGRHRPRAPTARAPAPLPKSPRRQTPPPHLTDQPSTTGETKDEKGITQDDRRNGGGEGSRRTTRGTQEEREDAERLGKQ